MLFRVSVLLPAPLSSLSSIRSVFSIYVFLLMIRRPPRSTLDRSSAASDVYKRQECEQAPHARRLILRRKDSHLPECHLAPGAPAWDPVSYTHLRAHETVLDLVCRLLLEKKKTMNNTMYDSDVDIEEGSDMPQHTHIRQHATL